jgi:hypothetical protein
MKRKWPLSLLHESLFWNPPLATEKNRLINASILAAIHHIFLCCGPQEHNLAVKKSILFKNTDIEACSDPTFHYLLRYITDFDQQAKGTT